MHRLEYLLFGLRLLHHLSAHFDSRGEHGSGEVCHIDALQVAHLLSRWRDKKKCVGRLKSSASLFLYKMRWILHCSASDLQVDKWDVKVSNRCYLAWWPAPGSSLSWTQCCPAASLWSTPWGCLKQKVVTDKVSGVQSDSKRWRVIKIISNRRYRFSPPQWCPWCSWPPWSLHTSHHLAGLWSERGPRSRSGNYWRAPAEAPLRIKHIESRSWWFTVSS